MADGLLVDLIETGSVPSDTCRYINNRIANMVKHSSSPAAGIIYLSQQLQH